MSQKMQPPIKRVFDFSRMDDGRVTTAEFKRVDGGFMGYWWTSGLNASNQLTLLCELQLAWQTEDALPEPSAEKIFVTHISPLGKLASGVRTTLDLTAVFHPEFRAGLLTEHLRSHREFGNYSDTTDGLVGSIAKQYQLAVSFLASTTLEFLAKWNDLPVTTVKKRIERARLSGVVETRTPTQQTKRKG